MGLMVARRLVLCALALWLLAVPSSEAEAVRRVGHIETATALLQADDSSAPSVGDAASSDSAASTEESSSQSTSAEESSSQSASAEESSSQPLPDEAGTPSADLSSNETKSEQGDDEVSDSNAETNSTDTSGEGPVPTRDSNAAEEELEKLLDASNAASKKGTPRGVPQKLVFSMGNAGALTCDCQYNPNLRAWSAPFLPSNTPGLQGLDPVMIDTEVRNECQVCPRCICKAARCDCNDPPLAPRPMPAIFDHRTCYAHCEEQKCSALFDKDGWSQWYQCIQG